MNFTPNTTDLGGRRYTYRAQPEIGHWNVAQLGNALIAGGLLELVRAGLLSGTCVWRVLLPYKQCVLGRVT